MALAASQPIKRTKEIEQTRDELARAIRSKRNDCIPHETARQLLEYDQPGHTALVGLDREAEHAVLWHQENQDVVTFPFDSKGLATRGPRIGIFSRKEKLRAWIDRNPREWGWINPRYR